MIKCEKERNEFQILQFKCCRRWRTLESSVFMVKNYSDNRHSIKNTKDLTLKQMCSTYLRNWCPNRMGSMECNQLMEDSSWKYLSLIGDEQVISLQLAKVYVFSDSVLCLGKIHKNTHSNSAWENRL